MIVLNRLGGGLACLLCLCFWPVLALRRLWRPGPIWESFVLTLPAAPGRTAREIHGRRFCLSWPLLAALPLGWNLLQGQIALVGPSFQAYTNPSPSLLQAGLTEVTPGICSLVQLRQLRGMLAQDCHPEEREAVELEYLQQRSVRRDLLLLLRVAWAQILGGRALREVSEFNLLDLRLDNLEREDVHARLQAAITERQKMQLAFVNADCVNLSVSRPDYRAALQELELVLADGVGIQVAARMQGLRLKANLNGTDLFPWICHWAEQEGWRIYFLGGREGVAEAMVARLQREYPNLQIAGWQHGYWRSESETELVSRIRASRPDLLLVALGVPAQELWIRRWQRELDVPVSLGVGGLFDFYSGRIPRAPLWLQELGLEWLWRLKQEPLRLWRRYVIGNPLFLWRLFCWLLRGRLR